MRVSIGSFDIGHDVCGAQAAGKWSEGRSVYLRVLHRSHRSPEGVRHRWPHHPVAGTHTHWSNTADDSSHPIVHDGMGACVRPDDGVCSDWFEVEDYGRDTCYLRCCSMYS